MDRSWFHSSITGTQAESLLKNEGKHGSFLFRPSQQQNGSYCLSVRVGDSVTHVRIQNEGEFFNLHGPGGDTFATLGELVRYYTDDNAQPLSDTVGTVIELKYPLPSVDHHNERFFHRNVTGRQAEERMLSVTSLPGTFLVRESQSKANCFVLSVVVNKQDIRVLHVTINFQDGKYGIGDGNMFNSLSELVNYYRRNIMKDRSGIEVTLKQAVDLTRLKASGIDYRVAQLDKEFTLNGAQRSGFWEEFEHLQMQQESIQEKPRSAGEKTENKKKNRYKNILPFDETRIILTDVDPSVPGSDYINANMIQLPDDSMPRGYRRYIATQGCLLHTSQDFWLMALQQECSIIVMITNIVEDGKNKCALYWSEEDATTDKYNIYQGTITVTLANKVTEKSYVKRVFEVVKQQRKGRNDETQTRTFYHYQYKEWKDKKVPSVSQTNDVLQFVEDIDKQWRISNYAGPLIVHCSAGIGRTGTFIVIDVIINQILHKGPETEIDIYKTILSLRQQRSGCVQTNLQYKFVYVAVKRYIEQRKNAPPSVADKSENQIYENVADSIAKCPPTSPTLRQSNPGPGKPKPRPKPGTKGDRGTSSSNNAAEARPPDFSASVYQNLDSVQISGAKNG